MTFSTLPQPEEAFAPEGSEDALPPEPERRLGHLATLEA